MFWTRFPPKFVFFVTFNPSSWKKFFFAKEDLGPKGIVKFKRPQKIGLLQKKIKKNSSNNQDDQIWNILKWKKNIIPSPSLKKYG
jgi:hypothetical protein